MLDRLGVASDDVVLLRLDTIGPVSGALESLALVWADLVGQARVQARAPARYFVFMATAGVIAAFGVINASSVLIVGAMAISPDLLPITAVCTGAGASSAATGRSRVADARVGARGHRRARCRCDRVPEAVRPAAPGIHAARDPYRSDARQRLDDPRGARRRCRRNVGGGDAGELGGRGRDLRDHDSRRRLPRCRCRDRRSAAFAVSALGVLHCQRGDDAGRRRERTCRSAGERVAPGRERDEDARPPLVLAVGRVVAVLLVGAALERRDPAHEQQEHGDEDGAGHDGEGGSVEEGDGVEEQPPPDEDLAEVVGVARVAPEAVRDEASAVLVPRPEGRLLRVGRRLDQQPGKPDDRAGDRPGPDAGSVARGRGGRRRAA